MSPYNRVVIVKKRTALRVQPSVSSDSDEEMSDDDEKDDNRAVIVKKRTALKVQTSTPSDSDSTAALSVLGKRPLEDEDEEEDEDEDEDEEAVPVLTLPEIIKRIKDGPHTRESLTTLLRALDAEALSKNKSQMDRKAKKALVAAAAAIGAVPCTLGSCRQVKRIADFAALSGVNSCWCRACNSTKGQARTRKWRSKRKKVVADAIAAKPEVKNTGATEDELADWLKPALEALKWEVFVMQEFRKADMIVRRVAWQKNMWLRIQLKASGAFDKKGVLKIDVGKTRTFNHCHGYGTGESKASNAANRMAIVCGVFHATPDRSGEDETPRLWLVDGSKVPLGSAAMHTSKSDPTVLCPETLCRKSIKVETLSAALDKAYEANVYQLTTYAAAWCDITQKNQRKEAFGMLAFRNVGFSLNLPTGNSTSVDATLDLLDGNGALNGQHKTMRMPGGKVDTFCSYKGVVARQYHELDGIARLVPQLVVRQSDDVDTTEFFLVYAAIPLAALIKPRRSSLKHGGVQTVFATADGKHLGRGSISMPLGKYAPWLTGKPAVKDKDLNLANDWLVGELGLRKPLKISPECEGPHARLTQARLFEISYKAVRPELLAALL